MTTKTARKPKPKAAARPEPVAIPPGTAALLSPAQVAAALGVSKRTVEKMVSSGEYPEADVRLGSQTPRWSQAAHNAWVAQRAAKED